MFTARYELGLQIWGIEFRPLWVKWWMHKGMDRSVNIPFAKLQMHNSMYRSINVSFTK